MDCAFIFQSVDNFLESDAINNEQLLCFLDHLKYVSFGNKKVKLELLSGQIIERLAKVFLRDDVSLVHRESIFDTFSSLLKCYSFGFDEPLICLLYELCFQFLDDQFLGLSALRCLASLVRLALPQMVVTKFIADDGKFLCLLLQHTAQLETHLLLCILNVLLQDNEIRQTLTKLDVYAVVLPNIYHDEVQWLEWTLQCLHHILSVEDRQDFYADESVLKRIHLLLGPFYPISIQTKTAKLLLGSKKRIQNLSDDLFKRCIICLLYCMKDDQNEYCRGIAVDLLRIAIDLRNDDLQGAERHYIRQLMYCVLPSDSECVDDKWVYSLDVKTNALLVISNLLLDSEGARLSVPSERVIEAAKLISRKGPVSQVKSLLRTLHSLSRSISHLKTTFNDRHFSDFAMDCLLNESDNEILTLACALLANLSLHFCPARNYVAEAIAPLVALVHRDRNASVTLNAIWALTNLSCQSTVEVKLSILNNFGSGEVSILNESGDTDETVLAKLLELYRNLFCFNETLKGSEVEARLTEQMAKNVPYVLELTKRSFESNCSTHTKEVAMSLTANVCAHKNCQLAVVNDKHVVDYIVQSAQSDKSYPFHIAAAHAVYHLLCAGSSDETQRQTIKAILTELSIVQHFLRMQRDESFNAFITARINTIVRELL